MGGGRDGWEEYEREFSSSLRRQISTDSLPTGAAYLEEHYPETATARGGGAKLSADEAATAAALEAAAAKKWPPLADADDGEEDVRSTLFTQPHVFRST